MKRERLQLPLPGGEQLEPTAGLQRQMGLLVLTAAGKLPWGKKEREGQGQE